MGISLGNLSCFWEHLKIKIYLSRGFLHNREHLIEVTASGDVFLVGWWRKVPLDRILYTETSTSTLVAHACHGRLLVLPQQFH